MMFDVQYLKRSRFSRIEMRLACVYRICGTETVRVSIGKE